MQFAGAAQILRGLVGDSKTQWRFEMEAVEMDAIRTGAPRAGAACLLALISGGCWEPCGPCSSILGLIALAGMLICFPLACLILLACGLRALVQGHCAAPGRIV
jgi:hypothetical protein